MAQKAINLTPAQREKLLRDLWVLNDARWFLKSTLNLGPEVANQMNQTVVGSFGKTEISRLLAESGFGPVEDIGQFKELVEYASALYFPKEHVYQFEVRDKSTLVGRILECYVHKAVSQAGGIDFYQCAAKTRLRSWLAGCGLAGEVQVSKDTATCEGSCEVTFQIQW